MKTATSIRLTLLLATIALPSPALRAETFNLDLGSIIKDGIHKALQGDNANTGAPAAGYPAPGKYDGSDAEFERAITIQADGRFELEALQKGNASRGMPDREQASWLRRMASNGPTARTVAR